MCLLFVQSACDGCSWLRMMQSSSRSWPRTTPPSFVFRQYADVLINDICEDGVGDAAVAGCCLTVRRRLDRRNGLAHFRRCFGFVYRRRRLFVSIVIFIFTACSAVGCGLKSRWLKTNFLIAFAGRWCMMYREAQQAFICRC